MAARKQARRTGNVESGEDGMALPGRGLVVVCRVVGGLGRRCRVGWVGVS